MQTHEQLTTPPATKKPARRSIGAQRVRDGGHPPFFRVDNRLVDDHLAGMEESVLKVYLVLTRRADNGTRQCYPGYDHLANVAGISRRTAIRAVKRLVELGLVHRERRVDQRSGDPDSNRYTMLDVPKVVTAVPLPRATNDTTAVTATPPRQGRPRHQGSVTQDTQTKPNQQDLPNNTHQQHPSGEGEVGGALHPYENDFTKEGRIKAGAWWAEVDPLLDATWLWDTLAQAPRLEPDHLVGVFKQVRREVERRLSIEDSSIKGFVRCPRPFVAKVLLSALAEAAAAAAPLVPTAPQSPPAQGEPVGTGQEQPAAAEQESFVGVPLAGLLPQRPRSRYGEEVVSVVRRLEEEGGHDSAGEDRVVAALKPVIGRSVGWRRDQVHLTYKAGLIERRWNGSALVYSAARDTPTAPPAVPQSLPVLRQLPADRPRPTAP